MVAGVFLLSALVLALAWWKSEEQFFVSAILVVFASSVTKHFILKKYRINSEHNEQVK